MAESILKVRQGGTGATTLTDNGVLIGNGTSAISATAEGATGEVLVGVTGGDPVWGKWLPQAVHKTTTETVTSSATPQTDDHLILPVVANATYQFTFDLHCAANASGGLKVGLEYPTGATGYYSSSYFNLKINGSVSQNTVSGSTSAMDGAVRITGYIIIGSTAGNFNLKWSQNASFGTGTGIYRGSTLTMIRIS